MIDNEHVREALRGMHVALVKVRKQMESGATSVLTTQEQTLMFCLTLVEVCTGESLHDSSREAEDLLIYKRAMESMAAQFIHPKISALEMARMQLGGSSEH